MTEKIFRVGITRDFLKPDGSIGFGEIGLSLLDNTPGIQRGFLEENTDELRSDQLRELDALLLLAPRVTAASLQGVSRLAIIARFGVGYDSVDVEACTHNGVMLTITPDGVRRPVASSVLCLLLALSHKLLIKDQLTRSGRWTEKLDHMGIGLTGRVLGIVGLGNIGREVLRLAKPLEMKQIATDPYTRAEDVSRLDVQLLELPSLMKSADFVVVCCALTQETLHLINAEMLSLMKPSAFLINVARGPIVDQSALTSALRHKRIQGAGLDVFEQEPIRPDDPLCELDNVILAPHALCWTDECFAGIGRSACSSILAVARGEKPRLVVNRDVLGSESLKAKLGEFRSRSR